MPLSSVLKWVERKGLLVFAEFQPKITQSPSPWRDPASKQLAEDDRREKTWLSSGFYACAQANIHITEEDVALFPLTPINY